MKRYPARGLDAHGADFSGSGAFGFNPNSGLALRSSRGYSEVGEAQDDGLFEQAQIAVDVGKEIVEVEQRITDNLPGSVIGDVAAAVYRNQFDAFGFELLSRGE